MNLVNVEIVSKSGSVPEYKTDGAAGMDVCAYIQDGATIIINPGETKLIDTGLSVAIPEGYEIQVRPRSGLALKNSVTVLNTPGTIDFDYRGSVGVILINHGTLPFHVNNGDRIAQLVLAKFERANFIKTDKLSETDRGSGGYGSTGK